MKDIVVKIKYDIEINGKTERCTMQNRTYAESELDALKKFLDFLYRPDDDRPVQYQVKNGYNLSIEVFERQKDENDNRDK